MPTPAFHFPSPLAAPIANDRVKLLPFEPSRHSAAFIAQSRDHPELWAHMPSGPFATVDALHAGMAQPGSVLAPANPSHLLLAIVDKTRRPRGEDDDDDDDDELAGIIAYLNAAPPASPAARSVEIGAVVVLPAFQRTHVATNAVGLLLGHAFAAADESGGGGGGLDMVRVAWTCSTANGASARVAERMGFEEVGVVPYHYRFARGRKMGKVGNGRALPPGSDPEDLWRDSILYSMSWERWAEVRERVEVAMSRR